ncbi:hypothetical protein DSM106972_001990 [Dulcicalothrix desertica PCC 7102]|uniref:Uncharacterized protein n=1 Tax=Dulcicalothrix desertica PCC 7102 TaxID=232991 RepID=A0A3S1CUI3_9CYAN|nr:hypothetical protein [Dulcicalothrix desertica]RUT09704.1 hypothetical protein DSM106972_001990 [Dulcicalothrix desertica PCC 7102]TWH50902.1 hypothetical protein CAL7102_05250 [Dulcicalothrix desertica PCC 7102]
MNKITDNLNVQLIDIISQLSSKEQKKVLDFAISLHYKEKIKEWDNISDEEAASLKAEFAEEDINFTEAVLSDYLLLIDSED